MANTGQLGSQEQRAAATTQQGANRTAAAYNQGVANPTASGMGYTSPFAADAATALAGGGQGALAAFTMGQYGSQLAQGGAGNVLAEAGLSEVASQYGVSAAELQNKTGYDLANALLGYEGTGLQSQGLAEQASTAAAQQGLEQSQYGVQQGQYPEEMQKAALENANAVKNLQDQGAIGGTLNTTGYQRAQATQGAEYGWQQADIFRNQQLAQLGPAVRASGLRGPAGAVRQSAPAARARRAGPGTHCPAGAGSTEFRAPTGRRQRHG